MSISLADQRSQTITLDEATKPTTPTLRRLVGELGYDNALRVVNHLVQEADIALGGDGDPSRCAPAAANALVGNGHRGIAFLVVAIREGMRRTDRDGRAFGKINAQLLNEWTSAQEAIIIGFAEDAHARVTVKNDNLGRDWMDRLEHDKNADKRKIARMSAHIENLKATLGTHENGQEKEQ